MREIVLDTETTGLDCSNGDKIVEIGVIELENHIQTGKYFHSYINPQRKSDPKAEKVHGLTQEFLSDKPLFHEIAEDFFSEKVIHSQSNSPYSNSITRQLGRTQVALINM